MFPPLSQWFFGPFLLLFVLVSAFFVVRPPARPRSRTVLFVGLHLASLLFVLSFIFLKWPAAESKFVEIGQYYTINAPTAAQKGSAPPATFSIGDGREQADFILDQDCKKEPCFRGRVDFRFESKADGPNSLTWEAANLEGTLRLKKAPEGPVGRGLDWVRSGLPRWLGLDGMYEDGRAGVALGGEVSRVFAVWESPRTRAQQRFLTIPVVVELNPLDAAPRIVIERPTPRTVELPNARNSREGKANASSGPSVVYLTSAQQSGPPLTMDDKGYAPTIGVSALDPSSSVNAFIELPINSGEEFILNTGLLRTSNALGERVFIGAQRGTVATVIPGSGGTPRWKFAVALVALWLVPLWFFRLLNRRLVMFVFLPAVQMLLAVRFVLGLRAYLWVPYSREAIEGAVFAAVLVPLLIYVGCYGAGLWEVGSARENGSSVLTHLRKHYRPFTFYVAAPLLLLFVFFLLRPETLPFTNADVLAFNGLGRTLRYLMILLLLPPLVWLVSLVIDRRLRHGARRDMVYTDESREPISYCITKTEPQGQGGGAWSRRCMKALIASLATTTVAAGLWAVGRSLGGRELVQAGLWLAAGLTGLLAARWLRTLGSTLRPVNHTVSVAARSLHWIMLFVSVLLVLKSLWNMTFRQLGAVRALPDALFPYVPVRTNVVFQLVILVLTVRLLAVFFDRWREADTPVGRVGLLEVLTVFCTPVLMFGLSLMASHDTGALLVHGPVLLGATLLVTGLWPLWKTAGGRRDALLAVGLMVAVLAVYYLIAFTAATKMVMPFGPQSTFTHRVLLMEGVESAAQSADTGGRTLIEAIEQNWRMMNYASEGGWTGVGYGNAPIHRSTTFHNITLSDLVFSVYVLAEHGALGGLALLALYLLIFIAALRMGWSTLRMEPLRLTLVTALALMIVFPALYMAAANVNQGIFTGQDLPLLGLRSNSDVIRSGIVLMLMVGALGVASAIEQKSHSPGWLQLIRHSLSLARLGRQQKAQRLYSLGYDPRTAAAAVAANIALVALFLLIAACFTVSGVIHASGNPQYMEDLDLARLRADAEKFINAGHIWYEPVPQGRKAGDGCVGGAAKNTAAPAGANPSSAYQLCIDNNLRGAQEGGTYAWLIDNWNKGRGRETQRGNGDRKSTRHDVDTFFQLELMRVQRPPDAPTPRAPALQINPGIYRIVSPFRPPSGWTGALVESGELESDGGVLIGSGVVLPLRAAAANDPAVYVAADPALTTQVNLARPKSYEPDRAFEIRDAKEDKLVFRIETVRGALGALLRPEEGDPDLYLNGCSLFVRSGDECRTADERAVAGAEVGTAPPIRLDDGDVIAYAPRDASGKQLLQHIFVYSRARLGTFSYIAWVDGERRRHYPQGKTWPMAADIVQAMSAAGPTGDAYGEDVAITINARLNRNAYDLLERWRARLDREAPVERGTRQLSLTLMDAHTGALLTLADHAASAPDPNKYEHGEPSAVRPVNPNLSRHRIGSVIKPFTAAASLRAFPGLHELVVIDRRGDKRKVFGLPLGGARSSIEARSGEVGWPDFLPRSDNLYAVTLALLGMCDTRGGGDLPSFQNASRPTPPLRLTLTDAGSSLGEPAWAVPMMFDPAGDRIRQLEMTPFAQTLEELFDVRAGVPQQNSFDTSLWTPLLKSRGLASKGHFFHAVSPEITNFALSDVRNFADLRAVLLGGQFEDLIQYGNVGSAWSNVYLAQSFARITTGRKVKAQIVVDQTPSASSGEEWFPGAAGATWRHKLLEGLEGVALGRNGTASRALAPVVREIRSGRAAADGGQHVFTVFCKTGTLDPDERGGGKLEDSIFVFTAGFWDAASKTFDPRRKAITGAIYLEQGTQGEAQDLAAELLKLLNAQFGWSGAKP